MGQVNQPSNLLDRIIRLERELKELRKAVGLNSASITSGRLRVANGAELVVVHEDGTHNIFAVEKDGGTGPYKVRIERDNGTALFDVRTHTNNEQFFEMRSISGHIVISDDAETGWGLASPRLTGAMYPTRDADMPTTTSGTYEEIWRGEFHVVNPYIRLGILHRADVGTTGQTRVLFEGNQIWESSTYSGTKTVITTGNIAIHGSVAISQLITVTIEARRISGSGNVGVTPLGVYGGQS